MQAVHAGMRAPGMQHTGVPLVLLPPAPQGGVPGGVLQPQVAAAPPTPQVQHMQAPQQQAGALYYPQQQQMQHQHLGALYGTQVVQQAGPPFYPQQHQQQQLQLQGGYYGTGSGGSGGWRG